MAKEVSELMAKRINISNTDKNADWTKWPPEVKKQDLAAHKWLKDKLKKEKP